MNHGRFLGGLEPLAPLLVHRCTLGVQLEMPIIDLRSHPRHRCIISRDQSLINLNHPPPQVVTDPKIFPRPMAVPMERIHAGKTAAPAPDSSAGLGETASHRMGRTAQSHLPQHPLSTLIPKFPHGIMNLA